MIDSTEQVVTIFRTIEQRELILEEVNMSIAAAETRLATTEQRNTAAQAYHDALQTHASELTTELEALRAGLGEASRQANADREPLHREVQALRKERDGIKHHLVELRMEQREWVEKTRHAESQYHATRQAVNRPHDGHSPVAPSESAWPSPFDVPATGEEGQP